MGSKGQNSYGISLLLPKRHTKQDPPRPGILLIQQPPHLTTVQENNRLTRPRIQLRMKTTKNIAKRPVLLHRKSPNQLYRQQPQPYKREQPDNIEAPFPSKESYQNRRRKRGYKSHRKARNSEN